MTDHITIAIDAMGGENSPDKTIEGISHHLKNSDNSFYLIFGNEKLINPLIKKYKINSDKYKIIHTEKIIEDTDTALGAAKKGKDTSLWLAMESLKKGESNCVVSAVNTGAQSLFENEISKVALLNIGSEEIKGNTIIKNTYQALNDKKNNLFEFCGYIEGNHIMDGDVNVIVTDGFTGNIALKTAEGTANFITSELKKSMTSNFIGKFSSLLNIKNLKKFKNKLDPRLYNGAILLGLNKPVIKSHGSTDAIGFANSLKVGEKVIKGRLIDKIKENIN